MINNYTDNSCLWRAMRALLILCICFVSFGAGASGPADTNDKLITIEVKDKTVKDVLSKIEKESGYIFFYYNKGIDTRRRVSVSVKNKPVTAILDEVFKNTGVTYEINGRQISLKSNAPAQNKDAKSAPKRKVTGVVTDADSGDPLIGVTVMADNAAGVGTSTNIDGEFSIEIPENASLRFSSIGYLPQVVSAQGKNVLAVKLAPDNKTLEEVVVIGYGSIDKKELTSAVSHISSEEMLAISSVDPAMQIQGKVAGVSITNTASGDPNNTASIQVRGVSSRSAGLGPLIVIDGVAGGNLQNINSNDIASIDVLKDGAASAIYGTRGSNGVIVVTTKSGAKDGQVHTDYQGYVAWDLPHEDLKVLDREQYLATGLGKDYGYNTDWFKEITRTGFTHNHTLTLSGGTERSNYRATLDVRQADGIDLRASRREYGGRVSFEHNSKNGLFTFSGALAPRYVRSNNSDWSAFKAAFGANPTLPVMDPDDPSGRRYYDVMADEASNPVELLKLDKDFTEYKFLDWHATAKINLLPLLANNMTGQSLSTQVTVSQQYNDTHNNTFRPSYHTLNIRNGYNGTASQAEVTNNNYGLEWIANYMLDRNGHNLKVMAGYSWQTFEDYGFSAENKNFPSDALTWDNLGQGTYNSEKTGRLGMASYKETSKLISYFGRISYNYNNRYMATASLRYEGSSRFGSNHKWGYFPAFSLGWRISEEDFMDRTRGWLDDLKLRGDFGVTGNQNIANYMSLPTYQGYGTVFYKGGWYPGWSPSQNPNPNLKWERAENWNVGVDFSLLKGLLSGSVNYYHRTQKDLLGDYKVPQPPYLESSIYTNVGTMRNTGLEFELDINAVRTRDFSYTIGLVGATNYNKFISFSNDLFRGQEYVWMCGMTSPGSPGSLQQLREGERIGTYVTWRYAGVDDGGDWLVYDKNNQVIPIGQATEDDKTVTGNGLPKFTMSWNNTFRYRNFDLSLYFRGAFGYDIFNVHELYYGLPSVGGSGNRLQSVMGKNSSLSTAMNQLTDYFIEKGDYLKLDVVTLGYTFNLQNARFIDRLRLYGTVTNLFTITGFSGVDPSAYPVNGLTPGTFGGDKYYYPSSTQVVIGAQVSF